MFKKIINQETKICSLYNDSNLVLSFKQKYRDLQILYPDVFEYNNFENNSNIIVDDINNNFIIRDTCRFDSKTLDFDVLIGPILFKDNLFIFKHEKDEIYLMFNNKELKLTRYFYMFCDDLFLEFYDKFIKIYKIDKIIEIYSLSDTYFKELIEEIFSDYKIKIKSW